MSTRREIKDGALFDILNRGIVYTEALGWLDMGHARGNDVATLKRQFVEGERSGKPSYSVMYRQDMGVLKFKARLGVGKFSHWEIKRGRYGYRLKPVSYESAVRRWDYYGAIGSPKNHGFRPILFPDPQEQCVRHQPYKPYTVNLPHFMTWLRPWDDFASGVVKVITNDETSLSFMGAKL